MRIMGIDYGDSRVGIAISDAMGWTAQGVRTLANKGGKKLLSELKTVLEELQPEKIVIGLPKNMDGSLGFRADATYAFAEGLKTIFSGEIIFWDERLSTVSAARILNETNTRGKNRKKVLDTVSACIILENYLNSNKF
ncbi:MAG TPA: Holliday junction resolvase RuvX [Candidatus Avimonoglobus intestinipullorum]|uniref:Putative pre-16S rRNA nuclease n=1 Tax=Candidatus Avimonoglobus intestinipullorum TaxID=2840699 RepID=A0A9D1LTM1_9FIRM|nr:Holliday junction resolvase RuvX [Candidatus Avimonoglobus intestinipullorum]